MSDLVEFLLARIAEDEAPSWALFPYECDPGCCAPEGWVGAQCRYCDRAPVYGGAVEAMTSSAEDHAEAIHQRSRVLAECEAKRRIVERWREATTAADHIRETFEGDDSPRARVERASYNATAHAWRGAMELAALPYADHPDYREEWRP